MAGSVGDDALAKWLIDQAGAHGLDVTGVHREAGEVTASTLILRVEGEDRRFLHALGAAASFTGEHVPLDLVPSRGVLLIGGYLKLAAWRDDLLVELLQRAQGQDCQVVFNVCVATGGRVNPKRSLKLARHVDVFVANEDEARVITDETSLRDQAMALRQAGARVAVITRGHRGLYAQDGAQTIEMGAFRVPLVDPSGCGDCFNAGLVAALLRGWDMVQALECGSAAGALAATALGCHCGVGTFAEVQRFLANHRQELS